MFVCVKVQVDLNVEPQPSRRKFGVILKSVERFMNTNQDGKGENQSRYIDVILSSILVLNIYLCLTLFLFLTARPCLLCYLDKVASWVNF